MQTTNDSITTPAAHGPEDPRAHFARATAIAGATIAGVRADQFDRPTPCEDFAVRDLVGHLVTVLRRVARMGDGADPFTVPPVVAGVADDAWPAVWAEDVRDVQRAWADDATLDTTVTLPWATLPGSGILAMYTNELSVHTWDLARATGQHPQWDDAALAFALALMQVSLPGEGRVHEFEKVIATMPAHLAPSRPPFGEPVPVPADASLIDRLVAWNGRRP
jgi:uncharacterized protein (TIGR03086 family)